MDKIQIEYETDNNICTVCRHSNVAFVDKGYNKKGWAVPLFSCWSK